MILAFYKLYGVLSQFTKEAPNHVTLAEFGFPKSVYPIGRLDWDTEGLLLLSDEPEWTDRLLNPKQAHVRTYHAQVENKATEEGMARLRAGVRIGDTKTRPCLAKLLPDAGYAPRNPPIRTRLHIPTSWIELSLTEGKNRQVRRMCAAVGHPVLRLIRVAIGAFSLREMKPGQWRELTAAERSALVRKA